MNPSRFRIRCLVALLLAVTVIPIFASPRRKSPPVKPHREYVAALAAADRFLHAWQAEDQEAGLMMLSDAAKQRWAEEQMEHFFSAGGNAAYEIGRGKKLKTGRYAFSVTLFDSGEGKRHEHGRISEIVVLRDGEEWEIDKLPRP